MTTPNNTPDAAPGADGVPDSTVIERARNIIGDHLQWRANESEGANVLGDEDVDAALAALMEDRLLIPEAPDPVWRPFKAHPHRFLRWSPAADVDIEVNVDNPDPTVDLWEGSTCDIYNYDPAEARSIAAALWAAADRAEATTRKDPS